MESKRQEKISKLLQKDLSQILQLDSKSLYSGAMITVTKVSVTPDLAFAKTFVSIFAPGADTAVILERIKENTKKTRHKLASRIKNQLRVVPDLQFHIDDSLDYIENIENLLKN
jgi:ribosome-binding factor A